MIRGRQLTDDIVPGIGDVEVGLVIEGQPGWLPEEGGRAEHAVDIAGSAAAGHGREHLGAEVVAPDGIVRCIGDIQPVAVDRQAARLAQRGRHQGPDDAAVDHANAIVQRVGDIHDVTFWIPCHAIG